MHNANVTCDLCLLIRSIPISPNDPTMWNKSFCCIQFIFLLATLLLGLLSSSIGQPRSHICKVSCHKEYFDIGKDCVEAASKCPCIAHCCWALDCRLWAVFAQCRKKCRVSEWNRFGVSKGPVGCQHFRCNENFLMEWDIREVKDKEQINCIQHCCFAFNCKKYSGYCREMCIP